MGRIWLLQHAECWPVVQLPAMIPQDLLDILVCPLCKKRLVLKNEGQALKCPACNRVYPIRDGIPILLVDEAVIEQP
jgi:uncharacterized protein YbaR (Trm112 family)